MKPIIFFLFIFSFVNNLIAQDELEGKLEKFKSKKIAYITESLQLTPKEAEVFWPVYNQFNDKRQQINLDRLKLTQHYINTQESVTEEEASKMADKYVDLQLQEAALEVEYNKKFKAVLTAKKVLKLYQAEVQFKRELLKGLRNRGSVSNRKL
jgi:Spy/CpxP family protein refolding chaperone